MGSPKEIKHLKSWLKSGEFLQGRKGPTKHLKLDEMKNLDFFLRFLNTQILTGFWAQIRYIEEWLEIGLENDFVQFCTTGWLVIQLKGYNCYHRPPRALETQFRSPSFTQRSFYVLNCGDVPGFVSLIHLAIYWILSKILEKWRYLQISKKVGFFHLIWILVLRLTFPAFQVSKRRRSLGRTWFRPKTKMLRGNWTCNFWKTFGQLKRDTL